MPVADNRHSQLVGWLKILLPLGAIALFSTLFLFSQGRDSGRSIPLAEVEEIARETRLSQPDFAGVSDDGTVFSLTAEMARPLPENPEVVSVEDIRLLIEGSEGTGVEVTAGVARFDTQDRTAVVEGLARIASTDGYRMETRGLRVAFDDGILDTLGPLEVRAPFGELSAGHLNLRQGSDQTGLQMVFNEGVRLIYLPEQ